LVALGDTITSTHDTAPATVKPRLYDEIDGELGAPPAWIKAVAEYAESPAAEVAATRKS
jgi:hypothetical protein